MQTKIKQLMESEGLTTSRFAELLAIQPSGVSHIVSGRNKPSFELLQRILRRFPQVNPDWLLLDSEQIYRSEPGVYTSHLAARSRGVTPPDQILDLFVEPTPENTPPQQVATPQAQADVELKPASIEESLSTVPIAGKHRANIERVVIFYDDGTFTSYDTKS